MWTSRRSMDSDYDNMLVLLISQDITTIHDVMGEGEKWKKALPWPYLNLKS